MLSYFLSSLVQKITLLVLILFIGSSPNVFASTIQLISGKVIESEITFRDDELIKVNSKYGIDLTYYLDEIELIDGQPPIIARELVEVNDPIAQIEPVEEIDDNEINETVTILEPIVIEESIGEVEPIVQEESAIEVEPIKDISIIEDQMQTKEPPSPFGPTIRENNSITESVPPVIEKIDEPLPEAQITKDRQVSKALLERLMTDKIIGVAEGFSKKQKNSFLKNKTYFQKKFLFIQKKLMQIPVKIRKDILGVMSLVFIFFYAIICFPLMGIAKKIKRKHAWLVWLPIVQVFYFVYIAKKPLWWSIFFLIPIANIILPLILFIFILRELKKSYWLLIPMLVPGISIFVLWYLAISDIKQG